MTKELLYIENFAGIRNAEIELARMNVFIGPQASGKSVCAKIFFFFKECVSSLVINVVNELPKTQIRGTHRDTFLKYFPPTNWGTGVFTLRYSCGALWIEVKRKASEANTIELSYSSSYDEILREARQILKKASNIQETDLALRLSRNTAYRAVQNKIAHSVESPLANENYFIPAGRSFFSTLRRSVFQFLASDLDIDPFLVQFGSFYEDARRIFNLSSADITDRKILKRISVLVCGTYKRIKTNDYIEMEDSRQVAIENCSSGQQEALPLVVTLWRITRTKPGTQRSTVFIEEPEAHLYPTAQREIVHLFAAAADLSSTESSSQYLITTHSPYILSALNNLMYGGKISRYFPDKRSHVTAILSNTTLIDPLDVRAYFVSDGRVRSIIDSETGLVEATLLDKVSNELSQEFEQLVNIEFAEEAA